MGPGIEAWKRPVLSRRTKQNQVRWRRMWVREPVKPGGPFLESDGGLVEPGGDLMEPGGSWIETDGG